ncbi:hypothetical protein [Candidatus Clavichlamydia salmonicola]|uniref:hypothetical protein n=1 Tax=Candidatus Clavichlamydia salmonicola TaxID=469812 RepID=UPI001890E010|nr:hypothetical protein [Candidatus Clavichlamydia salmonicola]
MFISTSALNQSFIDVICSLPSFKDLYISKNTWSLIKDNKPSSEEGFICLYASCPSLIISNFGIAPWHCYLKIGKGYLKLARKNPILLLLVTIIPLILITIRFIIASHDLFYLYKSHLSLKKLSFFISQTSFMQNQQLFFIQCMKNSIHTTKRIIFKQYVFQIISASSALVAITGLIILIVSACLIITISYSANRDACAHSIIRYCPLDISMISSAVLLGISSIGHFVLWIISTYHSIKKTHSINNIEKMLTALALEKKQVSLLHHYYTKNPGQYITNLT